AAKKATSPAEASAESNDEEALEDQDVDATADEVQAEVDFDPNAADEDEFGEPAEDLEEDEDEEEEEDAGASVWDEDESATLRQARKDAQLTASADSVRAYLKQIGKVALLTAEIGRAACRE